MPNIVYLKFKFHLESYLLNLGAQFKRKARKEKVKRLFWRKDIFKGHFLTTLKGAKFMKLSNAAYLILCFPENECLQKKQNLSSEISIRVSPDTHTFFFFFVSWESNRSCFISTGFTHVLSPTLLKSVEASASDHSRGNIAWLCSLTCKSAISHSGVLISG